MVAPPTPSALDAAGAANNLGSFTNSSVAAGSWLGPMLSANSGGSGTLPGSASTSFTSGVKTDFAQHQQLAALQQQQHQQLAVLQQQQLLLGQASNSSTPAHSGQLPVLGAAMGPAAGSEPLPQLGSESHRHQWEALLAAQLGNTQLDSLMQLGTSL
jgi:hypothetical protein